MRGGGGWLTETGGGSDADKTADDARAEADDAELLGEDVLKNGPGCASTTSGKVGVDDGVDAPDAQVRRASTYFTISYQSIERENLTSNLPLKASQPNQMKMVPIPTSSGLCGRK